MADDQQNMVISKNNSGFPDYLDFDKLRTEGIDYLGRLGGKIWTDHNVHDPGITILEVLCYALLDLGYRTNLSVEDLLTRNPDDSSKDNNFFTPAQILTCNPLTITDFRKLLIDIEGVKNAWLEIATDQKDFCRPRWQEDPAGGSADNNERDEPCIDFLNGLYHVYINLENEVETKIKDDPEEKEKFEAKIKGALMSHRNLCEDFIDIYFLCKQETGVCADIELEDTADAEKVYVEVVEKLRTFFSPGPQFYTLPQLLEKQKSIDEIFAGRPYNITESHGFADTEELEQLKLRREIHLSDVYHVLFEVEGVKAIHNLRLQTCNAGTTNPVKGWKYHIPQNHVPEFSLDCSGFQFKRNGMPVFIDEKKFEGLFEINFTHNGKVLHQSPSPYLDSEIPKGVYRNDLGDYYSIQNEFPRVYGIAEGGLPDDASSPRKAQAYQLKAYLLFFDQLLANYLSQLQHMRSLFALSASDNDEENHTYFINRLSSVPGLQQLLRFNSNESNANALGTEGTILVLPVDKMKLLELKDNDKLKTLSPGDFEPYTFSTMAEQDTAVSQLKNDLVFEQYECVYVTKADDCVYYYILTSSDEIALVSKKYFKNLQEAAENASSVKYIGTFSENYRSFVSATGNFSFDIELNLLTFEKYLQLIVENKELFVQRRQQFLNHLLSRFAEQFTDYALLSFGFSNDRNASSSGIKSKEIFLTHYADLSSNRGKAYDYVENNWNNDNVSGFENKVKAISGMANRKRHSLCNFEVAEYEEQFEVILKIAGTSWFRIDEKFDTKAEALMAAKALFGALPDKNNYQPQFIEHDNAYQLTLHYAPNHSAAFPFQYAAKEEAMAVAANITGLFIPKDPAAAVFESTYIYIPQLNDSGGKQVRRSVAFYPSEEEARKAVLKTITKIDDRKKWEYDEDAAPLGALVYNAKNNSGLSFINIDAFKIDINNSIVGKPDMFTYDLLDKENNFKFQSVNEFNNAAEALAGAAELLALLTGEENYEIFRNAATSKFAIRVVDHGIVRAIGIIENDTEEEAAQLQLLILNIVKSHRYFIIIDKQPNRWKFNYSLGYEKNNRYLFYSVHDYTNPQEALTAATLFYNALLTLRVDAVKHELFLVAHNEDIAISSVKLITEKESKDITSVKVAVDKLLLEQKEIHRLTESTTPAAFFDSVRMDPVSAQGLFVYRLIDKDRPLAFYSRSFTDTASARLDIKSLAKLFKYGAGYLQICMGGDIINKRKDEATKITWYHYQLKCLNQFYLSGPLAGKPLILFESTKGYQNNDDAEKAFTENYLLLIHLASDPANYGKSISLAETLIHNTDSCNNNDNIVFVPAATKDALGVADSIVITAIVKMALSYPIRLVQYKSKAFYELFSCEQNPGETNADNCVKKNEPYVYCFTLLSPETGTEKWQSLKFYTSAEEAKKEFDFFLMLLCYPGNYYVDCDQCTNDKTIYRVYLREVLAESAERFTTEEQAWGKEGVQKLICTSQTENAFHTYRRKEDCCYSFYIACGGGLVYHPCKYDTPQKRDDALVKLYQSLKEAIQQKAWQAENNDNTVVLNDGAGKPFAIINSNGQNENCISDRVATLTQYADSDNNYKEEEGRIVLRNDQNEIVAASVQKNITLAAWKEMLQLFVCCYPVKKVKDVKGGGDNYRYCIEIQLPGFNTCKEDKMEEKPCGCGSEAGEDEPPCYMAWKAGCCYSTCTEAELALQTIMRLLLNFNYYQPVFDCGCYAHGIAIQFSKNAVIADENITWYWQEAATRNWHNSEIVAVNPQCYTNPEMACAAVTRAKELVNSEGLHVVEHILLRPRCNPEDCQCAQYTEHCDNKTACNNFKWKVPGDDPCAEEKDICFVPGADRYSFIATVVLPAWPERFRKKENRALLENILYREAPAHVLLRILWLAPHDFCCFETKYKGWGRWLAQKKNCVDDFSVCDFLAFLFDRNYECLDDCMVCLPCEDDAQQPKPCFAEVSGGAEESKYVSQINELYCWYDQHCDQYEFTHCAGTVSRNPGIPGTPLLNVAGSHNEEIKEGSSVPVSISAESLAEKEMETGLADKDMAKRKRQVLNSRLSKYRKVADDIFEKSGNNAVAAKVQRFLLDPHPTRERLAKLIIEVVQNTAPEKPGKPLTKKQVRELLQTGTCYVLDKLCFNGKDKIKHTELKTIIEKLRKAEADMKALYDYWNFAEIAAFQPALNETALNDLFFRNIK
ncbi:hypothetical protein [Agriterribacter sp.]|uniref:hypothetical protein n=1 Tax=Agriterribacter sp. TaxID=2821509 RepID=UPI002C7D92C0|nr:hypothetical protein [Agriterribacter sp.]HTN06766.1 hypothetical protein [Agriterribacter sp.]